MMTRSWRLLNADTCIVIIKKRWQEKVLALTMEGYSRNRSYLSSQSGYVRVRASAKENRDKKGQETTCKHQPLRNHNFYSKSQSPSACSSFSPSSISIPTPPAHIDPRRVVGGLWLAKNVKVWSASFRLPQALTRLAVAHIPWQGACLCEIQVRDMYLATTSSQN